jgi:hypothetical protein
LFLCELSIAAGTAALTLPLDTGPFSSVLVAVRSVTIFAAKLLTLASCALICASLLDSI